MYLFRIAIDQGTSMFQHLEPTAFPSLMNLWFCIALALEMGRAISVSVLKVASISKFVAMT